MGSQVSARRIVVTDSNVLINLIHANCLDVLGKLPEYEFAVLEEVVEEISIQEQKTTLAEAFACEQLKREVLSGVAALTLYSELRQSMGKGEAASLAMAVESGSLIACDEKRVFLREARKRLGASRILTTPGIFVLAIRAGVLTVDQADAIKALLETKRFKMTFSSFGDVVWSTFLHLPRIDVACRKGLRDYASHLSRVLALPRHGSFTRSCPSTFFTWRPVGLAAMSGVAVDSCSLFVLIGSIGIGSQLHNGGHMTAKLTDPEHASFRSQPHSPRDDNEEGSAAKMIRRLAKNWSLLQKPDAAILETEGWFSPSRPPRGCEDC
jgi:predicted nucleic acid-binding protein